MKIVEKFKRKLSLKPFNFEILEILVLKNEFFGISLNVKRNDGTSNKKMF